MQRDLAALPPLEQEILIRDVIEQLSGGALGSFCQGLPAGPAAESCGRALLRPHLQTQQPDPHLFRVTRVAPGPATSQLPPLAVSKPDWGQVPSEQVDAALAGCGAVPSCIREQAQAAAVEGDALLAGAICTRSGPPRDSFTQECFFSAAESLAGTHRAARWADTLRLCTASERYVFGCLDHVFSATLPDVPPADRPSVETIAAAQASVSQMLSVEKSDVLRELYRARFWAQWTFHAYRHAGAVTGHLLDHLPAEAKPHIHAAAAAMLLERSPPGADASLDALAASLDAALAIRGPLIDGPVPTIIAVANKPLQLWNEEAPMEDHIPSTYYIGQARRPVAPDDAQDRRLALLEAAARLRTPPATLLRAVAEDEAETELVRWSALRLLGNVAPDAARPVTPKASTPLMDSRLKLIRTRASMAP